MNTPTGSPRLAAVIVLAAGEGTRMKSSTPKVLHRIGGRTLVGHAIAAARAVSPEHLAVVVRHERDLVAAHVDRGGPEGRDRRPGRGQGHRARHRVRPRRPARAASTAPSW